MSVAPDNGNDDCLIGTNTDSRKVQPCPDSKVGNLLSVAFFTYKVRPQAILWHLH